MLKLTYLKSLIRSGSGDSSKSFGLVISVIVGGLIGVAIFLILIYDLFYDGQVDTDLNDLGWFLICDSAYIFGAGLNKTISEVVEQRPERHRGHDDFPSGPPPGCE